MDRILIKRVEAYQTAVGVENAGKPAVLNNIFVRIAARMGDELIEGWGEGAPGNPAFTGQSAEIAMDDVIRRIGPFLLNKTFADVSGLVEIMEEASHLRPGQGCAISACDGALFDILGRFLKMPIYRLIREYLWLEPLSEDYRIRVSQNEDYIDGELFADDNPPAGGAVLMGREIFSSPEQLMHILKDNLQRFRIITQPFHRDTPHLSRKLKRIFRKEKLDIEIFADGIPLTGESVLEMARSESCDGAVYRMGRDGGFCNLMEICRRMKELPPFSLLIDGSDATALGYAVNIHGFLGITPFHTETIGPRILPVPVIPPMPEIKDSAPVALAGGPDELKLSGMGVVFSADFLEAVAERGAVISGEKDRTKVQMFPYANRKPDFRRVNRFEIP